MDYKENEFQNSNLEEYLTSLPPFIRESIKQSGLQFGTVEQLRSFVDNLNRPV